MRALLLAALAVPAAQADENRTSTVQDRPRPELDPLGVRAGGFLVFPNTTVGGTYDDNVFAADTGTVDDFILNLMPSITVRSDWDNHEVKMFGSADIARHADETSEDYEDYNVGAAARLDVLRDLAVSSEIRYGRLHEARSSPDDAGGIEPTEYDAYDGRLAVAGRRNRVALSADGLFARLDFDDATDGTGVTINNDDRDRDRFDVVLRAGYEIVPEYEAFVRAGLSRIDYDDAVDDSGVDRDSDGYEIVAGARIDITAVLFGDVFAGYQSRDYDDPSLETIDGATGGIDLTWNPTRLTTVMFGVQRSIAETTQSGASGNYMTDFDVSVDHELLRNLILSANAGISFQDYEGIDRDDEVVTLSISGRYLLNRNFYISLGYDYTQRDSDAPGEDFDRNVVMLRLKAQL